MYINRTTGAGGRDQSVASTLSVLPNVIEKSERTVIVHGLAVGATACLVIPDFNFHLTGFHFGRRGHADRYSVSPVRAFEWWLTSSLET